MVGKKIKKTNGGENGDHGSIRKKHHLKERQDYEFIRWYCRPTTGPVAGFQYGFSKNPLPPPDTKCKALENLRSQLPKTSNRNKSRIGHGYLVAHGSY